MDIGGLIIILKQTISSVFLSVLIYVYLIIILQLQSFLLNTYFQYQSEHQPSVKCYGTQKALNRLSTIHNFLCFGSFVFQTIF